MSEAPYISVIGAGQANIDPNSSALTVSGGITPMGGTPRPATFAGAARSAAVVNLRVPNQPITLTRVGGSIIASPRSRARSTSDASIQPATSASVLRSSARWPAGTCAVKKRVS